MSVNFTDEELKEIERQARQILIYREATRRARELPPTIIPFSTQSLESVLVSDEDSVDHSGEVSHRYSDPLIDRPGLSVFDEILKITDDLRQRIAIGCNCTCVH